MTLSKSGIEYLDYMWSFYTGRSADKAKHSNE